MSLPSPAVFGRGIVLPFDAPLPAAWSDAPVVELTPQVLADPLACARLVNSLHLAWVTRSPVVVRWALVDDDLSRAETYTGPVFELTPAFLLPHERLRFLCFTNNYDARDGDLKWWWTVKAAALGVTASGDTDGTLPDGTAVWIDGGPTGPLDLPPGTTVVRGEDVEANLLRPITPIQRATNGELAPDQLAAVNHGAGPARIVAPAGSGKTRTLTARIRHLIEDWHVPPSQLVAVAYNRRAADELRSRIGLPGLNVRTIHSLGWAILTEAQPGLTLIGESEVRSHLNRVLTIPKRPNADPTGPYLEALDEVRSCLRDPADVEKDRDDVPGFADAFDLYRQRLAQQGQADHGEQIYGAIETLLQEPRLRAQWQQRCRHVLVDEFQDLTPAYLLLLRIVASPQLQVFGVGDDDQVIYGYAGADPDFLIDFEDLFPGSAQRALETNYRCAPSIVTATMHLLGYNKRRISKHIRAARTDSEVPGLEVGEHTSDKLAIEAVDRIEKWIGEGVDPQDIAVLARVNSSLIPVKAALVGRDIASHDLLTADSLNRTTVRALFAWMRLATDPQHMRTADVLEAIRRPSRGLTTVARQILTTRTTTLAELAASGARLDGKQADRWDGFLDELEMAVDGARSGSAAEIIRVLTDEMGLGSSAHALDSGRTSAARSSHHDDLVAIRRAAAVHDDLATFITWLQMTIDRPPNTNGVMLSSVHRVKGMEWDRVIVFGVDRGSMPHELSTDREEERRVFHVALTRAKNHVIVLADAARPSRFLDELDGSAKPDIERPAVPVRRRRVSSTKMVPLIGDRVTLRGGFKGTIIAKTENSIEVLVGTGAEIVSPIADVIAVDRSPAGEPNPALAESLREWRRAKCSELGVPAYLVLHDSTLEEIAARAPASEHELGAITGIGPSKLEHYGDELLAIVDSIG